MITGKLVATHDEAGLANGLTRVTARVGEPVIRKAVDLAMRLMGKQFVAGETIADALEHAKRFEDIGFRYSYDMLGEAAMTAADAKRYYASYESAIHAIGTASAGRGLYDGPGISIKLSALHPRYSYAQRERVMSELYPRVLALTCSEALRHRNQHRAEGRPARALARSTREALRGARARRLERHRLCRTGLSEALPVCSRLCDRSLRAARSAA